MPEGRWRLLLLMGMLLLGCVAGSLGNPEGRWPQNVGRRSTTTRDEGPTGRLPGLAAAAKKQHASHRATSLAGRLAPVGGTSGRQRTPAAAQPKLKASSECADRLAADL